MPKTRAVLDSSPVELPHKKPATAPVERMPSLQSLPTPPRTKHSKKRKRGRLSRATDSDTDDGVGADHKSDSDDEDFKREGRKDAIVVGHKKRRTFQLDTIAEELSTQAEEDAFWTGTSATVVATTSTTIKSNMKRRAKPPVTRARTLSRSPTRSPSSSPPARLLRRNNTGLISPPPSRRHTTSIVVPFPVTPPPRTPKQKHDPISKKLFPERDSPNNPFLAGNGSPGSVPGSESSADPHTPQPYVEKPTTTFVFRGQKVEFENPLYDPAHPDRVPSPASDSPSRLPLEHPDFSPTEYCPPKLLFPQARKHNHARRRQRSITPTPFARSDPDEDKGILLLAADLKRGKSKEKVTEKGKEKETRRAPPKKSEWDSSDDEDEPEKRQREDEEAIPKIRMPGVVVAPAKAVLDDHTSKEEIGPRPTKDMHGRTTRRAVVSRR